MFVSHSTQKIYCERVMGYAEICLLKKQINFWNRLKFPNKNLILLGSFKESFGGIRERARQSDQRRAVWKCGQLNDILVCSSSENLTTENQIHFRNRLKFLNKDLIFVNFERTFRWKICENFWLPGINYLRLCPIAFSHSVYKNLNISYLIIHFNPPIQKKKKEKTLACIACVCFPWTNMHSLVKARNLLRFFFYCSAKLGDQTQT